MRIGVKKSEWINQITTHVLESKTWPSSNVMDAWLNGIIGFKWITFDWKENIVVHQNLFFFLFLLPRSTVINDWKTKLWQMLRLLNN